MSDNPLLILTVTREVDVNEAVVNLGLTYEEALAEHVESVHDQPTCPQPGGMYAGPGHCDLCWLWDDSQRELGETFTDDAGRVWRLSLVGATE